MIESTLITPWALASLSVSNLRAIADHTSELVSQVMMGTPLKILDFKDKFYQVQTPEGYTGWLDAKGLVLQTEEEHEAWKKSNRCFYNRISGLAFSSPGPDIGNEIVTDIVLGDLFEVLEDSIGFLRIKLPDGREGFVLKSECISFEEWISLKPDAEPVIAIAKRMMGFPYLWGGASTKAVDCSGFTKLMFYTRGIILARDASQQAKYGEPVDIGRLENLESGDLLFFGSSAERPGHVGIHLGNGDFIHSSGRVHISSIIAGDPKHDPNRNFVAARRILTELDSEGITKARSHPWYI
ncbi:MAG: C40 family peptidase [Bacteroidales bacterium]|nr:C40 family peptidase [Bacteroidales bacterium]